ncbi:MAG: hypothetical protein JW820_01285, partial [Spirochaetales bacterium]|nr:hypothetical protein [Spirochaetales bacterium]
MIRPLAGNPPGLELGGEFLQAWLEAAGLRERLLLARWRLPERPQPLELWDLWLEQQRLLLRSPLPEQQEESLLRAVRTLGRGSLRVRALPPSGRRPELQGDFSGLLGAAALLEAVRLAWAAVLSASSPEEVLPIGGSRVSVHREHTAPGAAGEAGPLGGTPYAPDPCLLELAALHDRLLRPDSPQPLQSLFDLRPWSGHARAAPDQDQERLLLRAAEAAGRRDVVDLLPRCRQAWAAWVGSADRSAARQPALAPARQGVTAPGGRGCRQIAGAPGAPGLASGPARLLAPGDDLSPLPGEILVCRYLPPGNSSAAQAAAGLLTEQGGA